MSCPWESFAQAPPAFCEQALCAWVREPGNTWSNLAFIAVARVMYRATTDEDRHLRPIAYITLATGIGSALYHATGTAWGELLDYVGMHLGGAWMLAVCMRRIIGWRGPRAWALFWALFASAMVPGVIDHALLRPFYMVDGILCALLEVSLFFTRKRARDYRWWWATWAFFSAAMVLWWLDVDRLWCNPTRHWLSGHALWHVLNAVGFYAAFRYYRQFDVLRCPIRCSASRPPPGSSESPSPRY